ncbi:unnamed protein product [Ostreobium quekettii]|uniref:Uncharacterized protein n=1 Tax=Ostreobium quekettii TaxID=121088 RepID=A0A8S1IUV0_9CHLO|nr:unnamed protein product [Ostreobium quekettii]
MSLPFPDNHFDAITMGYGLRNIVDRGQALKELHRVLRPGRRAAILDFNHSNDILVDAFQGFALEHLVVPVARLYGLEDEYKYLRPSIENFPCGAEQERLGRNSGFATVRHYEIGFKLMGILLCQKGR